MYTMLVMFDLYNSKINRSFVVNYKSRERGMKAVQHRIDKGDNEWSYAYNKQNLKAYAIYTSKEYDNMMHNLYFSKL